MTTPYTSTTTNGNGTTTEVQTDIKWLGDEVLFKIGQRNIKLWEVVVGLILLSIFLPMFRGSRNGNGKK